MNKPEHKKKECTYCEHCGRFTDRMTRSHGWYCPVLDEGELVRNTAKKVKEIIEILDRHFN